ncbi:TIGR02234 family membrane protein [Nocardia crassostreae]|uniref:TIGR02234 family membrane protein n=1 Tax=Nocardia crassostreae TaxID=53428 RepID=UPI000AF2C654|nr:TIGR02234 family membrane protein [Nocardia crassostreae]
MTDPDPQRPPDGTGAVPPEAAGPPDSAAAHDDLRALGDNATATDSDAVTRAESAAIGERMRPGEGALDTPPGANPRPESSGDAARIAAAAIEADAAEATVQTGAAPARRRPIGAVVLLTAAAVLLWVASRMTWVRLEVTSELGPPRTVDLNGGTWFGALTPLALALLATIAAVFAARGWLRRLLGVVVAVLAAVEAVPAYALLREAGKTGERAARLAELRTWEHAGEVDTFTLPAVLTLLGAVAAFTAGVLLTRMPADSARMSGKYDNPVFRKAEAAEQVAEHHAVGRAAESGSQRAAGEPLSGRVLWDALDAGADPTDDETNTPAAHDDPGSGEAGRKTR